MGITHISNDCRRGIFVSCPKCFRDNDGHVEVLDIPFPINPHQCSDLVWVLRMGLKFCSCPGKPTLTGWSGGAADFRYDFGIAEIDK